MKFNRFSFTVFTIGEWSGLSESCIIAEACRFQQFYNLIPTIFAIRAFVVDQISIENENLLDRRTKRNFKRP